MTFSYARHRSWQYTACVIDGCFCSVIRRIRRNCSYLQSGVPTFVCSPDSRHPSGRKILRPSGELFVRQGGGQSSVRAGSRRLPFVSVSIGAPCGRRNPFSNQTTALARRRVGVQLKLCATPSPPFSMATFSSLILCLYL